MAATSFESYIDTFHTGDVREPFWRSAATA